MNIKSKQNIFRSVMAAVAVATAACGAEIHAAPQDEPSDSVVSIVAHINACLLYTSPSPRDAHESRFAS